MIGSLPKSLDVSGVSYPIRTDFRIALRILQAWSDPDLNDRERIAVMMLCLYETLPPKEQWEEAGKQAVWFIDGGPMVLESNPRRYGRVMDWEQDEPIIFAAVNKVAGYETRAQNYIHWWTFLGLYSEIGESVYASVLSIRMKKRKNRKLTKYEEEFYRENRSLIDLKQKLSEEERKGMDELNELLCQKRPLDRKVN